MAPSTSHGLPSGLGGKPRLAPGRGDREAEADVVTARLQAAPTSCRWEKAQGLWSLPSSVNGRLPLESSKLPREPSLFRL